MFRHVVMFAWNLSASVQSREAAVDKLHEFAAAMVHLGTIAVHVDAGLTEDNFDIAVMADFSSQKDYESYRDDERHRVLISEHLAPVVHRRAAMQFELT